MKFRVLLLLIACLVGFPVSANSIALNPQDVRQALTDLPTRKLPEAEQQAVQQALEQTLAWLDIVERTEQAQKKLQEQLAAAPQQISAAQNDLQRLLASTQADPSQHLAKASVKELEDLLTEHNLKLRELQKDLNDANALIVTAQTRPERAQAEISSNQTRIQEINNLLKTVKDDSKLSSSEKNYALKA